MQAVANGIQRSAAKPGAGSVYPPVSLLLGSPGFGLSCADGGSRSTLPGRSAGGARAKVSSITEPAIVGIQSCTYINAGLLVIAAYGKLEELPG